MAGTLRRRIWKGVGAAFAAVVILAALLLGLFRVVLTQAPEYRQQIESVASRALGRPLRIGSLDARLGMAGPELFFERVELLSADGQDVVLSAGGGAVSVDLVSLVTQRRVRPGRVALQDIVLEVTIDEDGELLIGGQSGLLPEPTGEPLAWPDVEFALSEATFVLEDRRRGLGPWRFLDVELNVESDGKSVSVEGQSELSPDIGRALEFWLRASGGENGRDFRRMEFFVETRDLRFPALAGLLPAHMPVPEAGIADLRVWGEGAPDQVREITADAVIDGLAVPGDGQEAFYDRVAFDLEWNRLAGGWTAVAQNLDVRREGGQWRSPTQRVEYFQRGDEPPLIYLDAARLRLEDLAPLVALAHADTGARLMDARLAGDVTDLVAQLDMDPERPLADRVRLAARFEGLGLASVDGRPGVRNLTGRIEGDESGGWMAVESIDLRVEMPKLFRDTLTTDARGTLRWRNEAGGLFVTTDEFVLDNRDLNAVSRLDLRLPADGGGYLDLETRAGNLDVARASSYLPVGIMKPGLIGWLDKSLVAGRIPSATVVWDGPLKGFPFREDEGLFRASLTAEDLTLDYTRGWPAAENATADIVFENEAFEARVASGTLAGVSAEDVTVTIEDLPAGEIRVEGTARGPSEAASRFARESPLRGMLGYGLEGARVESGTIAAEVDLLIPLRDLKSRRISVDVQADGVSYALGPMDHPLEDMTGVVNIRDSRITSQAITGSLLGRPIRLDVEPVEAGGTRLNVTGRFGARDIEDLLRIPATGVADGEAELAGYLHFPSKQSGERFYLHAWSSLDGVAVLLPPPMGKPQESARRLDMVVEFPAADETLWQLRYGADLRARVRFDTSSGMRFEEARIHAGREGEYPRLNGEPGVALTGVLPAFDIDAWIAHPWGSLGGEKSPEAARRAATADKRWTLLDWLAGGDLSTGELMILGQRFPNQRVAMQRLPGGWNIVANGERLDGQFRLPWPLVGDAPIAGRLERLAIGGADPDAPAPAEPDDGAVDGVDAAAAGPAVADTDDTPGVDPRRVPALDLQVADLSVGPLRLNDLVIVSEHLPDGFTVREATATGDGYRLTSTATLRRSDAVDWSEWQLKLESDDVAKALTALGFQPGIDAKKGTFEASTHWQGGLRRDLLEVAEGTARVNLEKGSLTGVEPGAGRVFGLLSVQALPRRLTLDFRDVFESGFLFDSITGDFTIRDGQAYTSNLLVQAPAADVGIVGRVGLASRDYDQTAVVSTELGATLPIAGVIAGGPAVGAALFVIAEIFKGPMKGMVRAQYRITGPWEDPRVDRVASAADPGADDGSG